MATLLEQISALAEIITELDDNEECIVTEEKSKLRFAVKIEDNSSARRNISNLHIILRLPGYEKYLASWTDFESLSALVTLIKNAPLDFETVTHPTDVRNILLNHELETAALAGQQRKYYLNHIQDTSDNKKRLNFYNPHLEETTPYSIETTVVKNNHIQITVNLPGTALEVKNSIYKKVLNYHLIFLKLIIIVFYSRWMWIL